MQLNTLLRYRHFRTILIGGGICLLLVSAIFALIMCTQREQTPEELRLQHLDWLVQVIESYKQRYGVYPQPTARVETKEGIRHVWGYRPDTHSQASCTIVLDDDETILSEQSYCGGGVYDVDGNLIGWKGTITAESGLNTVQIAHRSSGRIISPLSDFIQSVPIDPAFNGYPNLMTVGFGEYVYAIRNVDAPGADGRQEYQVAATTQDPITGEKRTIIRGNYFVRSDDRDRMPASLIGSGLLFDSYGNPVEDQEQPVHILLDGQREGFPNPIFGDGEEILRLLTLKRRAVRLFRSIEERIDLISFLSGNTAEIYSAELTKLRNSAEEAQNFFEQNFHKNYLKDSSSIALEINNIAKELSVASSTFVEERANVTERALIQETQSRERVEDILRQSIISVVHAEEEILIARDDVLDYLDGEGIEEQTRQRIVRRLEGLLEDAPQISELFRRADLSAMTPFMTEDLQNKVWELGLREKIEIVVEDVVESISSSGTSIADIADTEEKIGDLKNLKELEEPAVFLITVTMEISVHFLELRKIITDVLEGMSIGGMKMDVVDASLKYLADALIRENERIAVLMEKLADTDDAELLLSSFQSERIIDNVEALRVTAIRTGQYGDFKPFLFNTNLLDMVLLEQSPGVPDLDAVENASMATYTGIPYPLP